MLTTLVMSLKRLKYGWLVTCNDFCIFAFIASRTYSGLHQAGAKPLAHRLPTLTWADNGMIICTAAARDIIFAHVDELVDGTGLSDNARPNGSSPPTPQLLLPPPPLFLPIEVCTTNTMVAGVHIREPLTSPLREGGHPSAHDAAHPGHVVLRSTAGRPPPPPAPHAALPAPHACSRPGCWPPIPAESKPACKGHMNNYAAADAPSHISLDCTQIILGTRCGPRGRNVFCSH